MLDVLKAIGCTILTIVLIIGIATIEAAYTHGALTVGIMIVCLLVMLTLCFYTVITS